MPVQVVPIEQLASVGLIEDIPPSILPPNAFTTTDNIRFHDQSATLFESYLADVESLSNVVYAAHWPSTVGNRTVVLREDNGNTIVSAYNGSTLDSSLGGTITGVTGGNWQHTIFNGGFHIILNNGNSTPVYLQADQSGVPQLPGWHSYAAETSIMDFVFDGTSRVSGTSVGVIPVSVTLADQTQVKIVRTPRNVSDPIRTETVYYNAATNSFRVTPTSSDDNTLTNIGTLEGISTTGFNFIPVPNSGGDTFTITTVSAPIATVTASVVRAYGNLLVAGNLKETGGRTLTGTVRTSDVAAPGQIPTNWNPFNLGVNTADEFILASTGEIQDMAELQGVLYVYTDSSIHSIQQTGSPIVPFQVSPVTDNYGANGVDSVIEVDGKHIVIGSDDVYLFAGHPGNISSIADGRVRDNFRGATGYKVVRYNSYDELWFYKSGVNDMYVWNYRDNVWTKRTETGVVSVNKGPEHLIIAKTNQFGMTDGAAVSSFTLGRKELALAPSFDTEYLTGIAFLVSADQAVDLEISTVSSNDPASTVTYPEPQYKFTITDDYKADIRLNGRFLNYQITPGDQTGQFKLGQIQLDIGKGGQR